MHIDAAVVDIYELFFCAYHILCHTQCDQIGRFGKFLATNFLSKVAQMFGGSLGNLKTIIFKLNCTGLFLGNFSNIWSHWSYL